jgi:hypothetical protein
MHKSATIIVFLHIFSNILLTSVWICANNWRTPCRRDINHRAEISRRRKETDLMPEPTITLELVAQLARLAGFEVPESAQKQLAEALESQIELLSNLPLLGMTEAEPEIGFDPRWEP